MFVYLYNISEGNLKNAVDALGIDIGWQENRRKRY